MFNSFAACVAVAHSLITFPSKSHCNNTFFLKLNKTGVSSSEYLHIKPPQVA
jgi:hypothetical protein